MRFSQKKRKEFAERSSKKFNILTSESPQFDWSRWVASLTSFAAWTSFPPLLYMSSGCQKVYTFIQSSNNQSDAIFFSFSFFENGELVETQKRCVMHSRLWRLTKVENCPGLLGTREMRLSQMLSSWTTESIDLSSSKWHCSKRIWSAPYERTNVVWLDGNHDAWLGIYFIFLRSWRKYFCFSAKLFFFLVTAVVQTSFCVPQPLPKNLRNHPWDLNLVPTVICLFIAPKPTGKLSKATIRQLTVMTAFPSARWTGYVLEMRS